MPEKKFLIVIAGPTAVGKTELCLKLAQYLETEIVSADSRQFYKEMTIGTAKPTNDELALVKHHFINSHSIRENYSVGKYENDALAVLDTIFEQKNTAILTGGSGLFIQVLCDGIDEMPETKPEIREVLTKRLENEGLEILVNELEELDPEYHKQVDKANPQRILRALEVCLSSGKTYSSFRQQKKAERPFEIIKIGLTRPREELYARIDQRMDNMLHEGLLEEARSLYPYKTHNALQTVGYKEIFDFIDGLYDWDEAVRLLKRNSRRYAKRQMTWFNKDKAFYWFEAGDFEKIQKFLEEKIKNI